MAIALDGHATGGAASATSTTVTLTTTSTNDIIVVQAVGVNAGAVTVSSVSDVAGLIWAKRKALVFNTNDTLEVWWAYSPSALSGDVITVTMSAALTTIALNAFGINGANTATPWDANGALPATNTGSNSTPTVTSVSTTFAPTILLGFSAELTNLTETAGAAYTLIDSNTVGAVVTAANQYITASSVQSSVTQAFGTTTTANWSMIADAIQGQATIFR